MSRCPARQIRKQESLQVEVDKEEHKQSTYLHPEAWDGSGTAQNKNLK